MLLSSGGDDGNNNTKLLFLLLSMVFFLSLCIYPVYAEEITNPYVPYEVTNLNIVKNTDNKQISLSFDYMGNSYIASYTYEDNKVSDDFIFIGRSNNSYIHIYCLSKSASPRYYKDKDKLVFDSYYYVLNVNLQTFESSVGSGFSSFENISYNNNKGNFFLTSTCNIMNSDGGYFFQPPPPPPPTILEGVSLEGVLTQVLYLLPSCLLWIASYLALRKVLLLLVTLLKIS